MLSLSLTATMRRLKMLRTHKIAIAAVALLFISGMAVAEKPNFSPQIYADGQAWGTKGLGSLPAPNGHNTQSFDQLFVFTGEFIAPGQLPVAEASPRNRNYNGGRWAARQVFWTEAALNEFGEDNLPVLKSYAEIQTNIAAGYLMVMPGADYFECPLLPVK